LSGISSVPFGNVFYAQEIDKLGIKAFYDLKSDLKEMQEIFKKVKVNDLVEYQNIARHLITAMKNNALREENNT